MLKTHTYIHRHKQTCSFVIRSLNQKIIKICKKINYKNIITRKNPKRLRSYYPGLKNQYNNVNSIFYKLHFVDVIADIQYYLIPLTCCSVTSSHHYSVHCPHSITAAYSTSFFSLIGYALLAPSVKYHEPVMLIAHQFLTVPSCRWFFATRTFNYRK